MPSKFRVRGIFKPLVVRVARIFAKGHFKPNHVTLLMLLFSLFSFTFMVSIPKMDYLMLVVFGILVFITGVLDGVDGALARITGTSTRFGAIFDSFMDRISDALILFAPAAREMFYGDLVGLDVFANFINVVLPIWLYSLIAFIGAFLTSYTRARVTLEESSVDMDVGILGRSERLIIIVIGSICSTLILAIIIVALLTNLTAIYRVYHAKKHLNVKDEKAA
ncbi:MAG: CDP-alcohol phosphatidyltransferase family protein [Promethearchaeota archaeon]